MPTLLHMFFKNQGSLVTLGKLAATISYGGDLTEIQQNLVINIGGIPIIGYLWKRDTDSQKSVLERIAKGGALASLKLKLTGYNDEPLVVTMSDLRRDRGLEKRVVIVIAPLEML